MPGVYQIRILAAWRPAPEQPYASGLRLEMRLEMRERRVAGLWVLGSSDHCWEEGKATLWGPAQALHPRSNAQWSSPLSCHEFLCLAS